MPRPRLSISTRKAVRDRAKGCCEYCLALSTFSFHPFVIEHVMPISIGGTDNLDNLALACQNCNNSKYNKITSIDPLSLTIVALFNPRLNEWTEHFTWDSNLTTILGKSAVGRATISCLKMNRDEVINLRTALLAYGVHPPQIL